MGGLRRVQMGRLVVWVGLQKLITFLGGWVGCMGGFIHGYRNGNVVSKCITLVAVLGGTLCLQHFRRSPK